MYVGIVELHCCLSSCRNNKLDVIAVSNGAQSNCSLVVVFTSSLFADL